MIGEVVVPFEQYIPVGEGLAVGEKLEIFMRYFHAFISLLSVFMGIIIPMLIDDYLFSHENEWNLMTTALAVIQVILMGHLVWQHTKKALNGIEFRSPIQVKN